MTDAVAHWTRAWTDRDPTQVTWFAEHLHTSLALIRAADLHPPIRVIDVGGGASTLPRDLLDAGDYKVTVLDIAEHALAANRARLGDRAADVQWIVGDVTTAELPPVELWHDRAVFHFLTQPEQRAAYVRQLRGSLQPGGQVVLSTFADDGPLKCSGLPVCRYSPEALLAELGEGFEGLEARRWVHVSPGGRSQKFASIRARRL